MQWGGLTPRAPRAPAWAGAGGKHVWIAMLELSAAFFPPLSAELAVRHSAGRQVTVSGLCKTDTGPLGAGLLPLEPGDLGLGVHCEGGQSSCPQV